MFIMWATGHYSVGNGTLPAPALTASMVEVCSTHLHL